MVSLYLPDDEIYVVTRIPSPYFSQESSLDEIEYFVDLSDQCQGNLEAYADGLEGTFVGQEKDEYIEEALNRIEFLEALDSEGNEIIFF